MEAGKKSKQDKTMRYCALMVGLIIVLLGFIGYRVHRAFFEVYTLSRTDFLLPGERLFESRSAKAGLPVKTLYLSYGGKIAPRTIKVDGPDSLIGRVHITSPEMALRYARLFTYPSGPPRVLQLDEAWGEVVPVSALDADYFFGNKMRLDSLQSLGKKIEAEQSREYENTASTAAGTERSLPITLDAFEGILSNATWRRNNFPAPESEKAGDGFIVRRALFKMPKGKDRETYEAYWVEEKVSSQGKINRKILKTIKTEDKISYSIFKAFYIKSDFYP